jgi:hypothetical protein
MGMVAAISSARRECLDLMLITSRRHLRQVLSEYVEHYDVHCPAPGPEPATTGQRRLYRFRTGHTGFELRLVSVVELRHYRGPSTEAPSGNPGGCGPLPAVLAHLVAVARARMGDRGTVQVQPARVGRYVITACRGDRDLVMMFTRRRRDWVLTAAGMITGGQPQTVRCRTVAEAMRLLGGQDPGSGRPSAVRAARLPRDSALAAQKNTVLRV